MGRPQCVAALVVSHLLVLCVLILAEPTAAQGSSKIQQNDLATLLAFRKNLVDPKAALSGWNASQAADYCIWRGVVCSKGRVVELSLAGLQLQGPLSDNASHKEQCTQNSYLQKRTPYNQHDFEVWVFL